MQKPLVIAYHLVWTAYGWWLPNDPRGSGSTIVHSPSLDGLGPLHLGRKQNQPTNREVRDFYAQAQTRLHYPHLTFDGPAIASAARGLATSINQNQYTCYACAIMPDHVHMVLRKHKHSAEEMIENLQTQSRKQFVADGFCDADHPVWTLGGWRGFLDRPRAVNWAVDYVECNPLEIGRPKQCWPFVSEYNNWPLHVGHSPNSPYARRLRGC